MLFLEKQIHVLKSAGSAFAEQIKSIFIETTYLKEIKISEKKIKIKTKLLKLMHSFLNMAQIL